MTYITVTDFISQRRLRWLPLCACLLLVALPLLSPDAVSQPRLPDVLPEGVDTQSSDPTEIMISVVKVVVAIVLWLGVLYLAVKTLIEAAKDVKEAHDGDSKWVNAGKSIFGGLCFFLVALALALWIQVQFLS